MPYKADAPPWVLQALTGSSDSSRKRQRPDSGSRRQTPSTPLTTTPTPTPPPEVLVGSDGPLLVPAAAPSPSPGPPPTTAHTQQFLEDMLRGARVLVGAGLADPGADSPAPPVTSSAAFATDRPPARPAGAFGLSVPPVRETHSSASAELRSQLAAQCLDPLARAEPALADLTARPLSALPPDVRRLPLSPFLPIFRITLFFRSDSVHCGKTLMTGQMTVTPSVHRNSLQECCVGRWRSCC
jgi:hypothetical protein